MNEKPLRTSRRGVLIMLLCAALMAGLAALPLGWFRLGDRALLNHPRAADAPYRSVEPTSEDYYLLRQLKTRKEQNGTAVPGTAVGNGTQLYLSGNNMQSDDQNMTDYAAAQLANLFYAGVLTREWLDVADATLYNNTVFYANDTLGFVRICVFDQPEVQATFLFDMVADSHTGKVVSLWLWGDIGLDPPDVNTALSGWARLNELDGLGDWAAPVGTDYEATGLYSASGSALMTCVGGPNFVWYALDGVDGWRGGSYLSLQLSYNDTLLAYGS